MDSDSIPVSFAQLEKDLISALESDARNQVENDAKLRAISQRVSYDEFRDIVHGAHLKPIASSSHPYSKTQKGRIWNNIALAKKSQELESSEARKSMLIPANNFGLNQLPISAQFLNSWQQSDKKSRLLILYKIGPTGLNNIFTIDMPTALLGEIFEALLCFNNPITDVVAVIKLMEALTKIKRFNLIVHFLNASERAICQQLIHKLLSSLVQREQDLAEAGITEWTIQELGKRFLVKL
ncbi:coiled-coil domain-containing protein 103-like [Daphnia carinata]|uniref:coiled-coil domain-containing protein 103-like n=1 Tax=Daphnia carinata TaxID=120202 RepID=UPI00257EDBCE|nr:coiled-coil domain-containing protein 103-like [Daphnia carinata]